MKIQNLFIVMLITLLAACSKEPEVSNVEKAEMTASLTESTLSLAKSLASINPKHSESYYRTMLIAIIQDCVKKSDPTSCVTSEVERLKYK